MCLLLIFVQYEMKAHLISFMIMSSMSQSLTAEPELPRNHKLPRRLDHGSSAPHQHLCTRDIYQQAYYEAIDTVSEEVKGRFDQSDIQLI